MSEILCCPRCGGKIAERLPGGAILIEHGGRGTMHLTGALRTECGTWNPRKREVCGNWVLLQAVAEGVLTAGA